MKTSSKKWHYRFIEFYEAQSTSIQDYRKMRQPYDSENSYTLELKNYLPKDFCEYWRRFFVPLSMIMSSILLMILSIVTMTFWTIPGILSFLIVLFFIGLVFGLIYLMILAYSMIDQLKSSDNSKDSKSSENIFMVKLSSLKHNFCPNLEYDDVE